MHQLLSHLSRAMPLAAFAIAACNANRIVDDWGPPAGYARITGRVTSSTRTPIVGAEVLVSQCASPIDGLLGSTHTAADGTYHISGHLPPGISPARAKAVVVTCAVVVNRSQLPVASVDVRFAVDSLTMPPQVLDLIVP